MLTRFQVSRNFRIFGVAMLFLLFVYNLMVILIHERENSRKIIQEGERSAKNIALTLERFTGEIEEIADEFAANASRGELNGNNIVENLSRTLLYKYEITSFGILFSPNSFDKRLRLHAPYVVRERDRAKAVEFDTYYDYVSPSVPWFHETEREGGWTKPFYDEVSKEELVFYTRWIEIPLDDGRRALGLLALGTSTKVLQKTLSDSLKRRAGSPYLVAGDGTLIAGHPDYASGEKTLSGLVGLKGESTTKIKGKGGEGNTYRFSVPLPSRGWIVCVETLEKDALENHYLYKQEMIRIVVSFCIFLTALLFSFLRPLTGGFLGKHLYQRFSIPLFLVFLACSVYICHLGLSYQTITPKERNAISNESEVEGFKLKYVRESLLHKKQPPLFIPTGLFLEAVDFKTSGKVNVKGIVWQKYYRGVHDNISQNVTIQNSTKESLKLFFQREFEDYTLVAWKFNINMSADFNYNRYPFHDENLWLHLKHQEFDKNIVLVPEIDAYLQEDMKKRLGLDSNILFRNWKITKTFFSYTLNDYNANFGIEGFAGQKQAPEIYFNVMIRPNIINVFVSNFLPIGIALFLIFAIFMTAEGHYVVRPYATIFLALIFLQINLRADLGAVEVVYIEYYYFLTYFVMAGLALNAILERNSGLWIVHFRKNLISRLFFWPFTGFTILLLNAVVFYS